MRRGLPLLPIFPVLMWFAARGSSVGAEDAPPPPSPAPALRESPAPVGGPKIKFDRLEHEFGPMRQNDKRTTTFTLTNVGTATLHTSVRSDCGCIGVTVAKHGEPGAPASPKADLEPGEAATITLTFDTFRFVGPLTKSIHVTSDDPAARETTVLVKVDVSAGIVLVPQNFFFHTALKGSLPTCTVEAKWKEGMGKPFKITSIEPTNMVPAGVKPEFTMEAFDAPPWHGYRVAMKFSEPPPVGMVTGNAILKTDDPETPTLSALIGGAVSGKVVVSQLRATFGVVQEGKGGTLQIRVRPFDSSIELGKVTAKSRKSAVNVKLTATDEPQMKGVWTLEIELPKDAAPGPIEDVVVLTTEVKGEETTEIPVAGTVVPK